MNTEIDPVLEALNRAAAEISALDIDHIIAYLRKQRGAWEKGEKPKKNEAPKLDKLLGLSPLKVVGEMRRL